jgi:hypothetical protein
MLLVHFFFLFPLCLAQSSTPSTDTEVPPLQWLYLIPSLTGSGPPPLHDASLGFDVTSNTLLVFGGESGANVLSQQTFLLDLDTLVWSSPVPSNGVTTIPPARSLSVGGLDLAAN